MAWTKVDDYTDAMEVAGVGVVLRVWPMAGRRDITPAAVMVPGARVRVIGGRTVLTVEDRSHPPIPGVSAATVARHPDPYAAQYAEAVLAEDLTDEEGYGE